jgi:hypothetical protein
MESCARRCRGSQGRRGGHQLCEKSQPNGIGGPISVDARRDGLRNREQPIVEILKLVIDSAPTRCPYFLETAARARSKILGSSQDVGASACGDKLPLETGCPEQ